MKRALLFAALAGCAYSTSTAPEIVIDGDNFIVTKDVRIKPGRYVIDDADGIGVVHVAVDNVTLDFQGAELEGGTGDPDTFHGMGIVIEGLKNVTIKNARVHGFKVGIYAKNCENLTITGCDCSRNFAQRLHSTPDYCEEGDWLWPHENDKGEWFENYGASIGLDGCVRADVHDNRGGHSQNGIVMTRTNESFVYDNDFSYHSGWCLAMYRSCKNEVSRNKFDYGVRGYSHGKFARGQDSAGMLVFEQCSDNVFAFNSATHGGDGFFLYAGNETLHKTGAGGCNRNLLYGNDFSHAVANAIEATFSDGNTFVENILDDSNYGVWAGFSYNTTIVGNSMRGDLDSGVAIEHGHSNHIQGNTFEKCGTAINLWANEHGDFEKWPYSKQQKTDSEGYTLVLNTFKENRVDLRLVRTASVVIDDDRLKAEGDPVFMTIKEYDSPLFIAKPEVRGRTFAFLPKDAHRGLKTILVGEWGPFDYSHVEIVPTRCDAWGEAKLFVYKPWDAKVDVRVDGGVAAHVVDGSPASVIFIRPNAGPVIAPFAVQAGEARASGTLYAATWSVKFFEWKTDPRKDKDAWEALVAEKPLAEMTTDKLDFNWGNGAPHESVPADHFATVATTAVELPDGAYEFTTTSDDGVRLTIDDKVVIENWTWHGPTEDRGTVEIKAGTHAVKLEHFELDGWAVLGLKLRKTK